MPAPRASLALLLLPLACAGARIAPGAGAQDGPRDARAALSAFADAVADGRWAGAYPLLSARWRAAASPSRLASDFAASGAVGRGAVERVRALLAAGAPVRTAGEVATLSVGNGSAARLVLEDGAWRVDALE